MKEHIDQRINTAKYTFARLNRFRSLKMDIRLMLFKILCLPKFFFSPTTLIYPKRYELEKIKKTEKPRPHVKSTEIIYNRFVKVNEKST